MLYSISKYLLIISICFSFYNCSNTTKIEEAIETVPFDEFEYLDKFNSSSKVFFGTPKYYKLKNNEIAYSKTNKLEELKVEFRRKSNNYSIKNINISKDLIFISKSFLIRGECGNYIPFLEKKEKGFILRYPKVVHGEVEISEKDTLISISSCELATILELKFIIPKSDLKNEKIFFEGKEILYN
jgi:hypothetical protein